MERIGQVPRRKKDHVITIRLTLRDVMMLNKVADYLEMDRSDLVRMYIRKNNNYYGQMMLNKPNNFDINTDHYKWGYTPQDVDTKK
jgi:hypothetical protein